MTTIWTTSYPAAIDTFSPALVNGLDEVLSEHPNILAQAIIALQTRINITNAVATGFGGLSFSPTGHATFPGVAGNPTLWVDNSFTPEHLIFTDSTSVDHDIMYGYWTKTGDVISPTTADNVLKISTSGAVTTPTLEIDHNNSGVASINLTGSSNSIGGVGHIALAAVSAPTVGSVFSLTDTGYSLWAFGDTTANFFGAVINPALSAVFTAEGMIYDINSLHTATGNKARVVLDRDEGAGLGNRVGIYATAEAAVASTRPSYSKFGSISYGSGNSTTEVVSSLSATGTTGLLNLHCLSGGAGTTEVNIYSQVGDIYFNARASGNIPFNAAAPNNALVGFTATSIIGALNELKSGGGTYANKALSNLSSVAINTSLLPGGAGVALGDTTHMFADLFLESGGVVNFDNGDVTLTHSANILTLGGGDLALGANNLTVTGSIASTGSRVTKGWFTDLEVTNAIAGSITGNSATVTMGNESSDTTCFPLFTTTLSPGSISPKTVSTLTFNSNTGALSSTLFTAGTITANTAFVPDTNDGAALGTTALQFSDLFLASGGVINFDNGDVTLTHGSNVLTLGGGDLALGSNSLTLTGSIASTGSRVLKGWFTDLEVTNAIAGSITGNSATVTMGNESSDTTCFPLFSTTSTPGSISPKTVSTLTFNSNTSLLTSTLLAATNKITLGAAGGTTGSVEFKGTTSGTVTVKSADVAGTWTLTLPTDDGEAGQALVTNGSGTCSWSTIIGGDSEDGMTVYKNIYGDFSVAYKDGDEIEVFGLPFNINAVQIKKITRKPTGSAVSVVKNRGVDLICTWTPDGTIAGKGSITTTSLGTFASTDEYIVEIEALPKAYNASTDSTKTFSVGEPFYSNDGEIAAIASDTVEITKSLLADGYNAFSVSVTLEDVDDSVKIYGSNKTNGSENFFDITALALGIPKITSSGAYQTPDLVMFQYIKFVLDGTAGGVTVELTRFRK